MDESEISTIDVMVTSGVGLLGYGYGGIIGAGWSLFIGGVVLGIILVMTTNE